MPGPLLPRSADSADPMAPATPKTPPVPEAGNPMAPVGPSPGAETPPPQAPAAGRGSQADPPSAAISDQLASARITARKLAMRRQRTQRWVIASMLVLLIAAGGLAIGFATGVIRFGSDPSVAKQEGESSSATAKSAMDFKRANRADERKQPPYSRPATLPDTTPETTVDPSEGASDPDQVARFRSELQAARKSLGERQYQQAKERIEAARQLAASDRQKQLVAGFKALTTYTEGFWNAVREGHKELEKAGELKVGDTVVSVVEVGPGHILIREAGENRRYSVDQLPARLAVAIAEHWFDEQPVNKLSLGAFYFVTPPIEVAQARRLWQDAANAGVDDQGLLALLQMDE